MSSIYIPNYTLGEETHDEKNRKKYQIMTFKIKKERQAEYSMRLRDVFRFILLCGYQRMKWDIVPDFRPNKRVE